MDGKTIAIPLAVLVCGGTAFWITRDPAPARLDPVEPPSQQAPYAQPRTRGAEVAADPTAGVVVDVDPATGNLVRRDNLHAAGSRRAVTIDPVPEGIRCPDGTCLPLLNGVAAAPAILRSPERGPLPPVVAIVVDRDGWDWYEHADGSMTTCRPHVLIGADGQRIPRVVTVHNALDDAMPATPFESPKPIPSPPPDTESRR